MKDPQRTAEFIYRIYDPTFYIAIDFVGKEPVEALGNKPKSCQIEVRKVPLRNVSDASRWFNCSRCWNRTRMSDSDDRIRSLMVTPG